MLIAALAAILSAQPEWIAPPAPTAAGAVPSWIWAHTKDQPAPTTANAPQGKIELSKMVKLAAGSPVTRVRAWLAADNAATLSVNGERLLESKSWASPVFVTVTSDRFRDALWISISADNGAPGSPRPASDPAGVCAVLEFEHANGDVTRIVTDDTWETGKLLKGGLRVPDAPPDVKPAAVLGPSSVSPWNLPASAFQTPETCPRFRKVLTLGAAPTTASVRIVGLGHYELRCNGKVVGDSVLNQAWSQYDKTIYTQTFDLAPYLHAGENVLAVTLGNSFWRVGPVNDAGRFSKTDAMPDYSNGEPFLLWIDGEAKVGHATVPIVTDASWSVGPSPLTFSHIYAGEDFDAREDVQGWDTSAAPPATASNDWKPARLAKKPAAELIPLTSPPIKTFETFKPSEIKAIDDATFTYVFPQNCSSFLRFTVSGPAGATVRFRPCEYMLPSGRVKFTYTWGTGKDIWHDYTLRGGADEKHETLFCYVGAQYVQIEGAVPEGSPNPRGLPVLKSLELVHTRAACPTIGSFDTDDRVQDGAFRLIDWSIRSNMSHVPTDCPHREKNGWLEQNWHMARAMSYRYDIKDYFAKVARDMRDAQIASGPDDGFVPTNAPWYLVGRPRHDTYNDAPEWGVSMVLVPWHLYEWYGDTTALASSFDRMKRWVDYNGRIAKNGLITSNLGDWYDYGHGKGDGPSQWTPAEVSATAIWALGAKTVADAAHVLGKPADEAAYRAVYNQIRADFQRSLYDPATATVKHNGSCQAGTSAALCIGLIPQADRERALHAILNDLKAREYQQTAGEVLHIFLIRALADFGGREGSDALHRCYARTVRGSYGYMVETGLTTLPESWSATPGTGNSMSHLMLGQLMEWHFAYVAGIKPVRTPTGETTLEIHPRIPPADLRDTLSHAEAAVTLPLGLVKSSWRIEGTTFTLRVESPMGVAANVTLPTGAIEKHTGGVREFTCDLKDIP